MQDLGKCLGYVSKPCPKCGRDRVEKYVRTGSDGISSVKHICEKCGWCVEDEEYFDWDEYYEELEPNYTYNWASYYK